MSKRIRHALGWALAGLLVLVLAMAVGASADSMGVANLANLAAWIGLAVIVGALVVTAWSLIRD